MCAIRYSPETKNFTSFTNGTTKIIATEDDVISLWKDPVFIKNNVPHLFHCIKFAGVNNSSIVIGHDGAPCNANSSDKSSHKSDRAGMSPDYMCQNEDEVFNNYVLCLERNIDRAQRTYIFKGLMALLSTWSKTLGSITGKNDTKPSHRMWMRMLIHIIDKCFDIKMLASAFVGFLCSADHRSAYTTSNITIIITNNAIEFGNNFGPGIEYFLKNPEFSAAVQEEIGRITTMTEALISIFNPHPLGYVFGMPAIGYITYQHVVQALKCPTVIKHCEYYKTSYFNGSYYEQALSWMNQQI